MKNLEPSNLIVISLAKTTVELGPEIFLPFVVKCLYWFVKQIQLLYFLVTLTVEIAKK